MTSFDKFRNIGLLILRIGIGLSFVFLHGWPKISGGPELWEAIGSSMANLGINFFPVFWGFMAGFSEFFGALLLILGFFFRPATFLLAFTMFVAMMTHLTKLDPWSKVSYPMDLLILFTALFFIGPGIYSLDEYFKNKKKVKKL
ncbi:MAG: DoxX family protein [Ignavibacteria bacterium]